MSKEVEEMVAAECDGRVALLLVGDVFLMTPAAARVCASLLTNVADWIDPVVAEPMAGQD